MYMYRFSERSGTFVEGVYFCRSALVEGVGESCTYDMYHLSAVFLSIQALFIFNIDILACILWYLQMYIPDAGVYNGN